VIVALAAASCGAPLMKLPSGPATPASDTADALRQATAECGAVRTLTAEVAASGKAAGSRFRGRLSTGVASPASARIEAIAPFGPPVFIFVATGDDATLLLPRDERILEHGRPADVLGAVAGVPLNAGDLFRTLTGCAPAPAGSAPLGALAEGSARGDNWRVISDPAHVAEVYLHREASTQPWRLAAVIRRPPDATPWRAEYRDHQGGVPRSIRLASIDAPDRSAFDLTLRLSQVETNRPLGAEVFRIEAPQSASPITLDELRNARPGVRED
jgi:hypothetical protein